MSMTCDLEQRFALILKVIIFYHKYCTVYNIVEQFVAILQMSLPHSKMVRRAA